MPQYVVRLSVCLFVRYRDHIHVSWKIISRLVGLTQHRRSGPMGTPPKLGWNRSGGAENLQSTPISETVQDRTMHCY